MMYIFDLDGTIALNKHRQHFLPKEGKKDWHGWHQACVDDIPNWSLVHIMTALLDAGHSLHIISGRGMQVYEETLVWLAKHGVPYHSITMRPEGDYRDDTIIKLEMLRKLEAENDQEVVQAIFDDRQKVVDMWRREGYTCLQVAPGDF